MSKTTKKYDFTRFLDRLREVREDRGLSARRLSVKAGLSPGFVGNLERGVYTDVSLSALAKLADVLDVSLHDLVGF